MGFKKWILLVSSWVMFCCVVGFCYMCEFMVGIIRCGVWVVNRVLVIVLLVSFVVILVIIFVLVGIIKVKLD